MNTCKTCKWWKPLSNVREEFIGMGDCENSRLEGGTIDLSPDGLFAGEAFVQPCQPSTGPDFGCVHHETRESA